MNRIAKKIAFVSMLAVGFGISAHAAQGGGSTSGGNGVVSEDGGVRFLDVVKRPTSMILNVEGHEATGRLIQALRKEPAFGVTTIVPNGREVLRSLSAEAAIIQAVGSLTWYLVPGPLPELNDRGVTILQKESEGRLVRLAAQSISEKTVLIDEELFRDMEKTSIDHVAAFFLHEALIRMYAQAYSHVTGPTTTEKIGNFVHEVFRENRKQGFTQRTLARYLNDAGIWAMPVSALGLRFVDDFKKQISPFCYFFCTTKRFVVYRLSDAEVRDFSSDGGWSDTGVARWLDLNEVADGESWKGRLLIQFNDETRRWDYWLNSDRNAFQVTDSDPGNRYPAVFMVNTE